MYASLSLTSRRRRVLDLTIASDIQALTKTHISKYYLFILLLSSENIYWCAAMDSIPGIKSADYTIGMKVHLSSKQGWRYLSFLSFSAVAKAFADV